MTPEAETNWRERIERSKQVLEARLDEDVPLEELAAAAWSSVFHFHRIFRGFTGETVREYGRRLRMERAAHRLTHGDDDILNIALDCGYDSHEAFTRAFKRHFGTTPSSFREERRTVLQRQGETGMTTTIDIKIEHHEPRRIAYVRHVGPYDTVGDAWGTLMKWGWSKMMFGKPDTFGLCFDDPDVTPSERLRYEACMVVSEKVKPKGDVQIRTLPKSTYAVTLHAGTLDSIGDAYAQLFAHVASETIDGGNWMLGDPPSLERYLCDPRKVKPEEMRTEICMPVHPATATVKSGP